MSFFLIIFAQIFFKKENMKRLGQFILFLTIIQLVTICNNNAIAQKLKSDEVPADVTQSLEYQYPSAKVMTWQKENNTYIATIKDDGSVGKVYISASGQWARTLFNVPQNELPTAITEYVKTNYPDYIISVSGLEEMEGEKTKYYIEVKLDGIGNPSSILKFATNGKNELISRNDPKDFKDPLAPKEPKPAPVAKETKPATTPAKPATASKPTSSTAKPATPAKPTSSTSKPTTSSTKPAPTATKPAATAKPTTPAKPAVEPKPEKPKKEKPEVIIKDELGNIALKPNTIPAVVTKTLTKKVMHPEELNWFLIDSMYVAKCYNVGKKTAVYITKDGVWEKTLTVLEEENVTGPMLKHLNDYYKGFRFKSAVKEQRADKNDKTMVEFYEKANYKNKLATTIFFDKTGKLIRTIDPDYEMGASANESVDDELDKYYEKMNMSLESDDAQNVPASVVGVFNLKYPKVTNVEWKEDNNMNYQAIYYTARGKEVCVLNSYGEIVETMVMGKVDNLSATIQEYLKKNYKNSKIVEYYTVKKIAEKLTFYKVTIMDKKTQQEDILWFNLSGKPVDM